MVFQHLFHEIPNYLDMINPFKPSVLYVRHRQAMQTQIRRRTTRRLIRVSTVCLHNVPLQF